MISIRRHWQSLDNLSGECSRVSGSCTPPYGSSYQQQGKREEKFGGRGNPEPGKKQEDGIKWRVEPIGQGDRSVWILLSGG